MEIAHLMLLRINLRRHLSDIIRRSLWDSLIKQNGHGGNHSVSKYNTIPSLRLGVPNEVPHNGFIFQFLPAVSIGDHTSKLCQVGCTPNWHTLIWRHPPTAIASKHHAHNTTNRSIGIPAREQQPMCSLSHRWKKHKHILSNRACDTHQEVHSTRLKKCSLIRC